MRVGTAAPSVTPIASKESGASSSFARIGLPLPQGAESRCSARRARRRMLSSDPRSVNKLGIFGHAASRVFGVRRALELRYTPRVKKSRSRRLLLAAALLVPWPAFAHAIVLDSRPAPNELVAGPDVPIELRFNSRIDRKRSRLTLDRPGAGSVPVALLDGEKPDRLEASLAGVAPGEYRLKWQVLSIDGHITRGEIPFRVGGR